VQVFAFEHFAQTIYPQGPENILWDYQGRRLVSTLLDPNFAGILVVFPLLVYGAQLSFGLGAHVEAGGPARGAPADGLARGGAGVLRRGAGHRRGAWRAAAPRAGRRPGGTRLVPFLPALVGFAASFRKFSVDESAMARVQSWLRAITVISDNPGVRRRLQHVPVRPARLRVEHARAHAGRVDGGRLSSSPCSRVVGLRSTPAARHVRAALRGCWARRWRVPEARGIALGLAAARRSCSTVSTVNSLLLAVPG
jgi:hypothetical protein